MSPLRVLLASAPAQLPGLFAEIENAVAAGHYAVGFFSYECGAAFEPAAAMRPGPSPLAWFGIYDRVYRFDHRTGAFLDGDPPGLHRFPANSPNQGALSEISFGLPEEQYSRRIATIHEWIRAGDVYQLNFTAPLRIELTGGPAALYQRLRNSQPVAFGAFLHWLPGQRVLSFSPELFFRMEESGDTRTITTRPMKGTASRGRNPQEDLAKAEWLRNDPKNRAENVMIVDLLRNDLGCLCRYGSVRVESLFAAERYPTLWQMTSTVTGELRPDVGFEQIFRALFPCGSSPARPKCGAMQLLAQIEAEPRGIYTGAIGFFSRERTVFNVAIRTLEMDELSGKMGVGGGIVIDSVAAEEFRECQLKAEFLTRPFEPFSLIETLLWQAGYPLLELHLDRLEDSANYFDFPCARTEVKAALLDYALTFADPTPRKVRLLLNHDGGLQLTHEILAGREPAAGPGRVCLAAQHTDSQDRMLFHKTTQRTVYARAFAAATQAGFDDGLFLNQRGEVTEGAISNVFIEKNGQWFTPPVECGLLAGVLRRHLLETRPEIEERILYPDDLHQADAVYLTNAVRGLRRVAIDWKDWKED